MIRIDGTTGGGQVLRTSLSLSVVTGQAFAIESIRGARPKPGLMRQHLTCVQAAQRIGAARVEGAELGSRQLVFEPSGVHAGAYTFRIGSAGSATLVLQTVLPMLLTAGGPSTVVIEGGTHNPMAPPTPFLQASFLPALRHLGGRVELAVERVGFAPAGGGRVVAQIQPSTLRPKTIERGEGLRTRVVADVAHVHSSVGSRLVRRAAGKLVDHRPTTEVREVDSSGPGALVAVSLTHGAQTACFVGFGSRGDKAERVAGRAAKEARRWVASGAAVEEHLGDQLLLPMAMAGGGAFTTTKPSAHLCSNAETIGAFLDCPVAMERQADDRWAVAVGR
jgi:RNA 3'-terminal phosphate cyclase (ATP)